jgi:hypothetical protein
MTAQEAINQAMLLIGKSRSTDTISTVTAKQAAEQALHLLGKTRYEKSYNITADAVINQALALYGKIRPTDVIHALTARYAVEQAMKLLGKVNAIGVDEQSNPLYTSQGIGFINSRIQELSALDGNENPTEITQLDDIIFLNKDTVLRVLPFGLAIDYARFDNAENYNLKYFIEEYEKLKKSVSTIDKISELLFDNICLGFLKTRHQELARLEGNDNPAAITNTADVLSISDDTALRVLPYGIAADFARFDKENDNYFITEYDKLKLSVASVENISDGLYTSITLDFINTRIQELSALEGRENPTPLTSLSGVIPLNKDTALRVLPFGLAIDYARYEKTSDFQYLANEYEKQKKTVSEIDKITTTLFEKVALSFINARQQELSLLEGEINPPYITDLTNLLSLSDDTAMRIFPVGLALDFLRFNNADNIQYFANEYERLKRTIKHSEMPIQDRYNITMDKDLCG